MSTHERAATRVCSECGVAKPETDFYATRKTRKCKPCELAVGKRRYESSKERILQRCAAYREANKPKIQAYMAKRYAETKDAWLERGKRWRSAPEVQERERERQRKRYAADSEAIQASRRAYYESNPEAKAKWDAYYKAYCKQNSAKLNAKGAKRRAGMLYATPPWANLASIARAYRLAAEISAATGVPHHVDHIVPLRGRNVCGLHVEWNLQVIPAKENRRKFNKHSG